MKETPDRWLKSFAPLLRRTDQVLVGILVGISLIVLPIYFVHRQLQHGGLIEIDQARPLSIEFQVDINTADWAELMLLPDVGETLAKRIVQSRETAGSFLHLEELTRVSGIGPKTFARIRPFLRPVNKSGRASPPNPSQWEINETPLELAD